ncbi:hypothetical protein DUNSADRAFT_7695 [Dunaliella salina]|uniref:Autophagy protein ATG5 UblA domain-containing protein n=1 Tax=Dunaliella salina TaxID=3046 RepID=A0ABQ7GKV8_DUNSA|nr:hypothetical protein DUNSADRAFT_7695 [Dunaliella salina]|eukprot:KAF5835248.1 hypothetical protein DUNSADRAFT_7695 [Dunaliella salina]
MDPLSGVWRCQIPVQVKLAENNNSSPTSLPPLYFIVPRQSYLSCLAAQAWPFVQHVLSAIPGQPQRQPWFDYEGIPLRGQFPIGLLYDLTTGSAQHISPSVTNGAGSSSAFGAGSGSSRAFGAGSGCSSALPWQLTLHYSPPVHPHEEALLNTQGAVACAAAPTLFLNSLKEACFICQGSEGSSAAMRMAGGAQAQLCGMR